MFRLCFWKNDNEYDDKDEFYGFGRFALVGRSFALFWDLFQLIVVNKLRVLAVFFGRIIVNTMTEIKVTALANFLWS